MGCRATIVTKYVCEYGGSAFNWAADEVYEMLTDNDVVVGQTNEDDNYSDWDIQNPDAVQAYVDKLKKLPQDKVNKYFKKNKECQDATNGYVVVVLEEWLDHILDGVIKIHWW
jgi:hypothetical protein